MKRSLLALALLAGLPLSAQASELSYNFIEADYLRVNIDDADDFDPAGFGLRGSFAMGEQFYGFGSYLSASDDVGGFDLDVDQSQLGLGYRHGVSDKADFIAELSWINQSVDVDGLGEADGNGGKLSVGIRGLMGDQFEGYAKANYLDGSDFDGDFSATLGAQFRFNETWGLTGEAEFGGDGDVYMIGVRASF
jgi:Ax21 family sulfation-dependent quorum factor